ncbi:DUF4912 domain-containing protein [Marininema halotolerans]|uniref:Uncharacterized protein n=1 Tax=Marininema halotolerans TaxID=1155944 RepID=A0A1I6TYZ9_9BACL|nr:DUF4912 domain-containing protein [Marininema halotolerans]SFS94400.1 protein of unknown function [Marininema halotolerans]
MNGNKLQLLSIGSQKVHAFWTVTSSRNEMLKSYVKDNMDQALVGVRLIDLDSVPDPHHHVTNYRDVFVKKGSNSCYINHVTPGHRYVANLGVFHNGHFFPVLRSNTIVMPGLKKEPSTSEPMLKTAACGSPKASAFSSYFTVSNYADPYNPAGIGAYALTTYSFPFRLAAYSPQPFTINAYRNNINIWRLSHYRC